MREPRWVRGAYAQAPPVRTDSGRFHSEANVEAWRGTPAELLNAACELVSHLGGDVNGAVSGVVTWADGTHSSVKSVHHIQQTLENAELEQVLAARLECSSEDGALAGTLIARPRIPGVQLHVSGNDKSKVIGLSELVFQRMMIGYVDRMGGWRGLAWILSAIAPLLLVSIAVSPGQASQAARIAVIAVAAVGSLATFLVIGPYFQVSRGFDLVASIPDSGWRRVIASLPRVYRHRRIRSVLGVLGVLAIGAVGNKLADLLPWP